MDPFNHRGAPGRPMHEQWSPNQKPPPNKKLWQAAAAGAVAGSFETACCLPAVVAANALQANASLPKEWRGYYQGFRLNTLTMSFTFAGMMVGKVYHESPNSLPALTTSTLMATALMNPLEVLNIQQRVCEKKHMRTLATLVYSQSRYKGFFAGAFAASLRNALYISGLSSVSWIQEKTSLHPLFVTFCLGAFAGYVSHPLHTISTQKKLSLGKKTYQSICVECWKSSSFFKGVFPRLIRTSIGSCVVTTVFKACYRGEKS